MEEDRIIAEENEAAEATEESSGVLILDGEAWKRRGSTTYTSLLDRYGAADLFSAEHTEQYQEMEEEENARQQEMTEYLFSGQMQTKSEDEAMIEQVFSEEIRLTKVQDYSRKEEDYSICFALAEIFFVLVFLYILVKINAARRKRRESYAAEIDMES